MESTINFPGNTRFVGAQEAMQHLEQNFITFQKIFADSNIPKSEYQLLAGFDEYQLLAGFDEDLIRGRLGYLNQIHVLLRFEPQDMDLFLLHLSQVLENFTAVIFTDKSTYRLPAAPEEFYKITCANTCKTASTLSQNADAGHMGGSFNIGCPSGQGNNGRNGPDDSRRKGKERESEGPPVPPDSSKEGNDDTDPEHPGPDGGNDQSAELSFRVSANLLQGGVPFQTLEVQGVFKIKRTPELQDPSQPFAICIIEFTNLCTTNGISPPSKNQKYHHFQLDIRIDPKEDNFVHVSKTRPWSTPEYNPELKVSKGSKKIWSILASGALSLLPPKATIGSSGSRTGEQFTNTERIVNVSRIMYTSIRGVTKWTYHLVDRFEQDSGLTLSPEKLPFAQFTFGGPAATPPPPPAHLNVEISTYWTILSPPGGSTWTPSGSGNKPTYSNLCKIITLDLPKDLQGSHMYIANLLLQLDTNPTISTVKNEIQGLGTAIVVETEHTASTSI